jgi:hypothetical protein
VEDLARVLGFDGPIVDVPPASGGGWGTDGLLVLPNGNWSMRARLRTDGTCTPQKPCEIPTVDLVDDSSAKRIASSFIAAVHPGSQAVSVERNEASVRVTLEMPVSAGVESLQTTVTIGAAGTVVAATGTLGAPQKVGTYPLATVVEVLDRLQQQPQLRSLGVQARACTATTAVECLPPVLKISSVTVATTIVNHSDGTLWIVPAYEFTDQLGSVWVADALPDRYLKRAG